MTENLDKDLKYPKKLSIIFKCLEDFMQIHAYKCFSLGKDLFNAPRQHLYSRFLAIF